MNMHKSICQWCYKINGHIQHRCYICGFYCDDKSKRLIKISADIYTIVCASETCYRMVGCYNPLYGECVCDRILIKDFNLYIENVRYISKPLLNIVLEYLNPTESEVKSDKDLNTIICLKCKSQNYYKPVNIHLFQYCRCETEDSEIDVSKTDFKYNSFTTEF